MSRGGMAGSDLALTVMARSGVESNGRLGVSRLGVSGSRWAGSARIGMARNGMARNGTDGQASLVKAQTGKEQQ